MLDYVSHTYKGTLFNEGIETNWFCFTQGLDEPGDFLLVPAAAPGSNYYFLFPGSKTGAVSKNGSKKIRAL